MRHPLIDFAGDSEAVELLFDDYCRIDDDSNGDDNDDDGREGTTVIGTRVLDGRTGHGEVARTSLHGGNRLASMSLLEEFVFGSSVGEVVAARAGDRPTSLAVDCALRAVKRRLAMTIPMTAGPSSLLSLLSPSPLQSLPSSSSSSLSS
jgi:hypothetical protein